MSDLDAECPRCHGKGIPQPAQAAPVPAQHSAPNPENSAARPSPILVANPKVNSWQGGCILALLIFIGFPIALMVMNSGGGSSTESPSRLPERGFDRAPTVVSEPVVPSRRYTLAQYNSIQMGMSHSEAIQILGGPGDLATSRRDEVGPGEAPVDTAIYTWQNSEDSYVDVMIQDGKVVQKKQVGLN